MDCCCNRFIPVSTNDLIVIRPASKTFVNGMAESYSFEDYNSDIMTQYISRKEYERIIDQVNGSLFNEYPCPGCLLFGYCCCPCTLGLSFVMPYLKVKKAMKALNHELNKLNHQYKARSIKFELKVHNSTSYILMYLPPHKVWK